MALVCVKSHYIKKISLFLPSFTSVLVLNKRKNNVKVSITLDWGNSINYKHLLLYIYIYIRNASLVLCFITQMAEVKLDIAYCKRKCTVLTFLLC
jgi:hypothetical protein